LDLQRGFASGFSPLVLEEDGADDTGYWNEWNPDLAAYRAINAEYYYPRYLIVNPTLAESWNWWFFLYPYNDSGTGYARALTGVVCDEDELCFSSVIKIPWEFNIVDVASVLPAALKPAGKNWAGFGSFYVCDPFYDTGSCDGPDYSSSTESWSYERAQGSSLAATWDVMHKTPRTSGWSSAATSTEIVLE
jgi:hypothetical protein